MDNLGDLEKTMIDDSEPAILEPVVIWAYGILEVCRILALGIWLTLGSKSPKSKVQVFPSGVIQDIQDIDRLYPSISILDDPWDGL